MEKRPVRQEDESDLPARISMVIIMAIIVSIIFILLFYTFCFSFVELKAIGFRSHEITLA